MSDLAVAQQTGSLPQNVNFAVDIDYAKLLLDDLPNESTWQPSTLSEAATATVLVIAGANGISSLESAFAPYDPSNTTPDEILVNFGYDGYWDAIHYTLRHLSIDFVDPESGKVLASASFQGDTFSGATGIARSVLQEVIAKFGQ